MRHNVKGRKLSRTAAHRKALLNNLVQSLVEHKAIKTTDEKAKETQRLFDRLVTFGKKNDIASRREAYKFLKNRTLVKELFDEISPALSDRNGGYTRIDKLYIRRGDGALISKLQILGFESFVKAADAVEDDVESETISEEKSES